VKGKTLSLLFLLPFLLSVLHGQRIGECPDAIERQEQAVMRLKGALVDADDAAIAKVKVILQERKGKSFADIASVSTGADGKFDFGDRSVGAYRIKFHALIGFCRIAVPVNVSNRGWKGIRVTLPVASSDSCPKDCEDNLKLEEDDGQ